MLKRMLASLSTALSSAWDATKGVLDWFFSAVNEAVTRRQQQQPEEAAQEAEYEARQAEQAQEEHAELIKQALSFRSAARSKCHGNKLDAEQMEGLSPVQQAYLSAASTEELDHLCVMPVARLASFISGAALERRVDALSDADVPEVSALASRIQRKRGVQAPMVSAEDVRMEDALAFVGALM